MQAKDLSLWQAVRMFSQNKNFQYFNMLPPLQNNAKSVQNHDIESDEMSFLFHSLLSLKEQT
jgi:hypothetical protein